MRSTSTTKDAVPQPCPSCGGSGQEQLKILGPKGEPLRRRCRTCGGKGTVIAAPPADPLPKPPSPSVTGPNTKSKEESREPVVPTSRRSRTSDSKPPNREHNCPNCGKRCSGASGLCDTCLKLRDAATVRCCSTTTQCFHCKRCGVLLQGDCDFCSDCERSIREELREFEERMTREIAEPECGRKADKCRRADRVTRGQYVTHLIGGCVMIVLSLSISVIAPQVQASTGSWGGVLRFIAGGAFGSLFWGILAAVEYHLPGSLRSYVVWMVVLLAGVGIAQALFGQATESVPFVAGWFTPLVMLGILAWMAKK